MDDAKLPAGVGQTALAVARARAVETRRDDRFFDDPLADAFVQAAGVQFAPKATGFDIRPYLDAYVPVRTRFFDEALLGASTAGIRQIVVLGAGLDARAFRLAWPPVTRVFELDAPDVFAFKESVIAERRATPSSERRVLAMDLRDDWPAPLLAMEFRPDQPSAWLMEGLLMYLTEADRDVLMDRLTRLSAAGSRLALEPPAWTVPNDLAPTIARGIIDQTAVARALQLTRAAQVDTSVTDPSAWLEHHGWRAELYDVAERFDAYGRTIPPAARVMMTATRRRLVTAERLEPDLLAIGVGKMTQRCIATWSTIRQEADGRQCARQLARP